GQDHTQPGPGERTIAESLSAELKFPEAVVLGQPFAVGARWTYQRTTTAREYQYAANDVHRNVHVLSKYEITAPEVNRAYAEEAWIVRARFWDAQGKGMTGAELFVQCFLIGPCAQVIRVLLQDDGVAPDAVAGDGTYTALHRFTREAEGLWKYLVIAQDVNTARPDMTPEQAARVVGGIVRTHQLTISFGSGTCRLIPDGYIHVIGGLT
ncbi:MAG TPA: choice-of-anchor X domain-containing protein, partial [Kofleriaceae bacterium]